jgi:hypothetical protein
MTDAAAPETTEAKEPGSDIDYSWLNEAEAAELEQCDKEWKEMGVEVLDVKRVEEPPPAGECCVVRLAVTTLAKVKIGKRIVKRKFRMLRAEEVWPFRDERHNTCSGRGYVIFTESAPNRVATTVTIEYGDGETREKIEHRVSCACSSARYRKAHPEVIMDGGYGFIPLEKGGERALASREEIVEEEGRQDVVETSKQNGAAKLKQHIEKIRSEIASNEEEANKLRTEIEEIMAPFQEEQTRLSKLLDGELRPARSASITRRRLAEAEADAAEALAKRLRALAKEEASITDYEVGQFDEKISAAQKELDRLPIPSRIGRLRRNRRVLIDKVADLRKRLERKVAERASTSDNGPSVEASS